MTLVAAASRIDPEFIADLLLEARARTLLLVAPLSDEELRMQHDPLMSPILWDLGHIAHFEELWLTRNLDGPIEFVEMPGLYNPFEHPRARAAAWRCPTWRIPRDHERDPRPGARRGCHAGPGRLQSAAPRRLRLPDGAAARVPAQRDHPADAAAQARRAVPAGHAARARRECAARDDQRRGARDPWRHGPVPRRAGYHRHRRPLGRLRQRAAGARGRRGAVLDRHSSGHQPGLPDLHRGRRVRVAASTGRRRAGGGGPTRARSRPSTGPSRRRLAHADHGPHRSGGSRRTRSAT